MDNLNSIAEFNRIAEKLNKQEKDIVQLNDRITKCEKKRLIIETGLFDLDEKDWDKASDPDDDGVFSYTKHIKFKNPFDEPPKIFLPVTAADQDSTSFWAYANKIKKKGFDLTITTNDDSSDLYAAVVEWLAFLQSK